MWSKWQNKLFVLLVFIVPVLAWLVMRYYENKVESLPVLGKKGHTIADFALVNQDGEATGTGDWQGRIVVVDFFFTHCPTICPTMTMSLKKISSEFEDDHDVLIQSISIDPERDSVGRLRQYAADYNINHRNWDLLTGEKKYIYRLARNSFMVVATDGDGGPDDFIHSEKLVLIDPKRRIRGYYDGTKNSEVKQLITDIKKLKDEK